MEGDNTDLSSAGGGASASSRWNPTKEQINMLENLYMEGIRTPSAEQIQHITSRLKAYGHIEGKNVFYWFQNHKARQRQKQKQENMAYFNRFHRASPVFPPPCPKVVCSPYYIPPSDLGFYPHQYPKVLLPGGIKRRPRPDKLDNPNPFADAENEFGHPRFNGPTHTAHNNGQPINSPRQCNQETLALFPQHPTGILQARTESFSLGSTFAENSTTPSSSSETTCINEQDQSFFDFFCGNSPSESH